MQIDEIHLWKFKQFKESKVALRSGLTLLVGGNNSGKSSLLQAAASWQFCKTIIEIEKGVKAWTLNSNVQGVGLGIVDFTPLNVPSLVHLWTNLKSQKTTEQDGYTLKIKIFWSDLVGDEKFLEFGMSLANDRLFVKTTATNLALEDIQDANGNLIPESVPNLAYMPPFAGITERETRLTTAMRARLIGQGLSGGVIRNVVYDMYEANKQKRLKLKGALSKIGKRELEKLRTTDSWEILQKTLQEIFNAELSITPFNDRYHSYLKIDCIKGNFEKGKFKRYPNFSPRDLMVEGSGFLQWLSVFALALSEDLDVILLDEPDAHLHPTLQQQLVEKLKEIADNRNKQIFLATHSTELIRSYEFNRILRLENRSGKYLSQNEQKIGVLAGIGASHSPQLHALINIRKMLFVEGESDERFLRILCEKAGFSWPKNLVVWRWTGKHSERLQLFLQLKFQIPELKAISIRDRDNEDINSVGEDLVEKGFALHAGFSALKWRRRHIENYLFCVPAIARAAIGVNEETIRLLFVEHAISISPDLTASEVPAAIFDAHGKAIMSEGENSIVHTFGCTRDDIARAMKSEEIPTDIKTFFLKLHEMCEIETSV
ncbi:ABC-type branched-subunit amino acid transport system ATPase component [Actimicrobium sp. GrIS 1.19]|uniref:ATP-dependent nuclease n=1 Tax=Actimicrobium sp. GrIS 1.19 TaxID=3071708 RepID=UPI002DFAF287|nr:ABC-type branched-subunit amino acid transport system ATPase component [Actimicrobium sp. GrIS 1.19]